ncbi:hypothetical protein C1645_824318 [Glomus cerebriforme]|uniref:F-box domain-containing protein n=1 Tax=Glomus cerebriforme TaxID=658196 RepID=A0A397SXP5_9GLOM|nr:hypothetical protein C1645_824318 [Glomus cerebriforme]
MPQLFADCLNEILEYLEGDMITLYSCLLVNHLWCEISVRIFWRNSWDYNYSNLRTLISCLPTESKEILSKNGIIISTSTSKPPMFNYASFCKGLSINRVDYKLKQILRNQQSVSLQNLNNNTYILAQELYKLFFSQGSLKILDLYLDRNFNFYPGAKECLKNLSELRCKPAVLSSEILYQLSQTCHNILSLDITVDRVISKELTDLISAQKNLKHLDIKCFCTEGGLKDVISSLTNPNKITKLCLYTTFHCFSLSFIIEFTNLQELELDFDYDECFKDFEKLQYAFFPKLQILKIEYGCPKYELLIKFLEKNGKNLRECYISYCKYNGDVNLLKLAITEFCPNLKKFFIRNRV